MTEIENNEDEFFSKVEKRFNQLRGTPLLISPKDWSLLAQWKVRGIPAIVIIEALEKGFERASVLAQKRRTINSLSYFKQIVEDGWESFQKLKVGKDKDGAVEGEQEKEKIMFHLECMVKHFDSLSEKHAAQEDISRLIRKCSSDIKELLFHPPGEIHSIETVEEELSAIEDELSRGLLKVCGADEIEKAKKNSEEELLHMRDVLDTKQFHEMIRKFTVNKLRKSYGIPRISLFFS